MFVLPSVRGYDLWTSFARFFRSLYQPTVRLGLDRLEGVSKCFLIGKQGEIALVSELVVLNDLFSVVHSTSTAVSLGSTTARSAVSEVVIPVIREVMASKRCARLTRWTTRHRFGRDLSLLMWEVSSCLKSVDRSGESDLRPVVRLGCQEVAAGRPLVFVEQLDDKKRPRLPWHSSRSGDSLPRNFVTSTAQFGAFAGQPRSFQLPPRARDPRRSGVSIWF